eukprot:3476162-Pleurochrysis_carterae.AAC.2
MAALQTKAPILLYSRTSATTSHVACDFWCAISALARNLGLTEKACTMAARGGCGRQNRFR